MTEPRPTPRPAPPDPARVAASLLRHFRRQARDLPWRRTADPYAVWVSEIMLQQTQVATVIPYYERWMTELPDLASVARAPVAQLLRLWAGLGYYGRPRRLQAAAKEVLTRFLGGWPQTLAEWKSLPGIGDYTAGALCSIAFNQPTPAVDGNVSRVLSRLWGLRPTQLNTRHRHQLRQLAGDLVGAAARLPSRGRRNCADFNQALMELGAVHCTPQRPRCTECPLARLCVAYRVGRPDRYPVRTTRDRITVRRLRVWILRRRGRFLVQPESADGWNRGLWRFPTQEFEGAAERGPATDSPTGVPGSPLISSLFRLSHAITRYRFHVEVCEASASQIPALAQEGGRWLRLSELPTVPLSGLHRKIAARLAGIMAPRPPPQCSQTTIRGSSQAASPRAPKAAAFAS